MTSFALPSPPRRGRRSTTPRLPAWAAGRRWRAHPRRTSWRWHGCSRIGHLASTMSCGVSVPTPSVAPWNVSVRRRWCSAMRTIRRSWRRCRIRPSCSGCGAGPRHSMRMPSASWARARPRRTGGRRRRGSRRPPPPRVWPSCREARGAWTPRHIALRSAWVARRLRSSGAVSANRTRRSMCGSSRRSSRRAVCWPASSRWGGRRWRRTSRAATASFPGCP